MVGESAQEGKRASLFLIAILGDMNPFSQLIDTIDARLGPILEPYLGEAFAADLVIAAVIFFLVLLVLWILKYQVLARLATVVKKTSIKVDDLLLDIVQGVGSFFFFSVALFAATRHIELPELAGLVIEGLFLLAIVYEGVKIGEKVIVYILTNHISRHKKKNDEEAKRVSTAIIIFVRIVLWSMGAVLILSNLGFNVSSLIAGLGIGGLAISLALQNVFSDFFSSFSIVMDKPFEEGDFIIVGEHMGVVKKIGLKTTRIQALQGEEIVISNNELTSTRIQNFKKLQRRRVVFTFGVTYDTTLTKLKKIPSMVKKQVEAHKDQVEFDRAHFNVFADSSLNFEVVYYLNSADYNVYMDIQEAINLGMTKDFRKEKIEFAFPSRTIYMAEA